MTVIANTLREPDPYKVPCFAITRSLMEAFTVDEMNATCRALHEVNALHLPFPVIAIEFSIKDAHLAQWGEQMPAKDGDHGVCQATISDVSIREGRDIPGISHSGAYTIRYDDGLSLFFDQESRRYTHDGGRTWIADDYGYFSDMLPKLLARMGCLLVTALATPTVLKESKINKRADRGGTQRSEFRGADNRTIYLSRTRLSVPAIRDDTGRTVRPHMRRGHVHHFWTGRRDGVGQRVLIKKFVPPVPVNAPTEFQPKDYTWKKDSK